MLKKNHDDKPDEKAEFLLRRKWVSIRVGGNGFLSPQRLPGVTSVGCMFSLSAANCDLSFLLQNWTLNVGSLRMKSKHAPLFNQLL